ncbi:MAG: MATE family efflux transporter [Pseudomonadota bacterium]
MTNHPTIGKVQESKELIKLALPLVANNVAIMGMSTTDTVMAGRISALDLAAIGVGGGFWSIVFIFGLGTLLALSPIVAQRFVSQAPESVGPYTQQSFWLAQCLAILLFVLLQFSDRLVVVFGLEAELIPKTGGYLKAISFGLPAIYAFLTLRFTSEGIGKTQPIMWMALITLILNGVFNYIFMFGKLGMPAMGAVGCGWASALAMWCQFFFMLIYVSRNRDYKPLKIFENFRLPDPVLLKELVALGVPIGLTLLAEVGLFGATSILMGGLGIFEAAAHQVAINYAAMTFMVPLGITAAITIRVGHALGRSQSANARQAGIVGIAICGLFMACAALLLIIFKETIVSFYTDDPQVVVVALTLLTVAAFFQISDGLQVGAMGALRGFKDTRTPLAISVVAYWLIGFPMAYVFGVILAMGPQYVWWALVAGLSTAALLLGYRFHRISL